MDKILTQKQWSELCEGYIFTGCAIRKDRDIIYVIATADMTQEELEQLASTTDDLPCRLLNFFEHPDYDELIGICIQIDSFQSPIVGVSLKPVSQGLVVANDIDGSVLPVGGGKIHGLMKVCIWECTQCLIN